MSSKHTMSLVTAVAVLLLASAFAVGAFAGNNPVDEQWWPTEFGEGDEAGATNYTTKLIASR